MEDSARSHFENLLSSPEGANMLEESVKSLQIMMESHEKTLSNVQSSEEAVALRLKFLYTV